MVTVSSESTDRIGIPDISFTENKVPVKSSVTENNCPSEPCTSNTVEPEPCNCSKLLPDPETIRLPVTAELCRIAILCC